MPPPICAKCRQSEALEGDTWCLGCSSWDALGRELSGHWDVPGARILAADLVVSCVRQVRGLRGFAAGLVRQAASPTASGANREAKVASPPATTAKALPAGGKRPLPAPPPPPLPPVKGEDHSEEEEEEEEEIDEEPPSSTHRPLGGSGGRPPPEPDHSPGGRRERRSSRGAGESRASEKRERRTREEGEHKRKRHRKGHRGGRKHQRLHRLGENPLLPVHRQLPASYWELGSLARGRDALDRL